ncbi:uncharacterized protein LOC100907956 [Galendromus occidentalis]|uniref:Uncharacterized protein LOC100907956 n=1 Tax=Galendromus occidentalis TaxID=34638 RepID=A0AAJ7L525_9ACAR|nr:uncharacterized protein LOC100907956 [Galendromus occidentalis]
MDTPTLKCPRSGRVLTPLSMDYWRLKKKLNRIISDSSSSDEENDETPLKKSHGPAKEAPVRKRESGIMPPRNSSPNDARSGVAPPILEKIPELSRSDVKPRRSRDGARSSLQMTERYGEDSDDEDIVFKARRRAQKFTIESSPRHR